jgi:hypothetical protein
MFALVLHLLVLSLQVLDLGVLYLQFLQGLVVLGVGVGGLDTVLLLLFLDLLQDPGQLVMLDLVTRHLVLYLLQLVNLLQVQKLNLTLLGLARLPLLVLLELLRKEFVYTRLVLLALGYQLLELLLLDYLQLQQLGLGSVELLVVSEDLVAQGSSQFVLPLDVRFGLDQFLVLLLLALLLYFPFAHGVLELGHFFYFAIVVLLELFLLFFQLDLGPMLVIFALLLVPQTLCSLFDLLVQLGYPEFQLHLGLFQTVLLYLGVVQDRFLLVVVPLLTTVSVLYFLYPLPQLVDSGVDLGMLLLQLGYLLDSKFLLVHQRCLFALQFIPHLNLLIQFLFEFILLVFLFDLNFLQSLDSIFFYDIHLQAMAADGVLHVHFSLLELLGLLLQLLQIFLDVVRLLGLLLDDFGATRDPGCEIVDIALVHFTFPLVVLLGLQMFGQVVKQHLRRTTSTVILLFRGYNSGSIKIFSTS